MEAKGPRSRGVETMCRKWVSERPMNPKNSFKNLPTSPATHSEAPNSFPLYTVPSSRIKLAWLTRFDDIFLPPLNYARGQFAISHSEGIRNLARDLMLSPRPPIRAKRSKTTHDWMTRAQCGQLLYHLRDSWTVGFSEVCWPVGGESYRQHKMKYQTRRYRSKRHFQRSLALYLMPRFSHKKGKEGSDVLLGLFIVSAHITIIPWARVGYEVIK